MEYTHNLSGEMIARDEYLYVEEGTITFNSVKAYEKFLSVEDCVSLEAFLQTNGMPAVEVTALGNGEFIVDAFKLEYNDPDEIEALCNKLMPFCSVLDIQLARDVEFDWDKYKYVMEVDKKGKKELAIKCRNNGFWDYEEIEDKIPDKIIGRQYLQRGLYQYKQYQSLDAYGEYFGEDEEFARDYISRHYGEYGD